MTITTTPQLIMLRSLVAKGWPDDLIRYIWERAGGTEAEWLALADAGLVLQRDARWELTQTGKREFHRQSVGRYF